MDCDQCDARDEIVYGSGRLQPSEPSSVRGVRARHPPNRSMKQMSSQSARTSLMGIGCGALLTTRTLVAEATATLDAAGSLAVAVLVICDAARLASNRTGSE